MRPALEAAIAVARAGQLEDPPIQSPTRLLPYLEFSKYPQAALDVARRVLDEDDEFRARVVEHVDVGQLGEAAELFLARPDGWGAKLAKLEASASSQAQSQKELRDERRATKQLQITKDALEQARSHAYEEAAQAGKLRDALAAESAARREAEGRIADLESATAKAIDERSNAVRELKEMERRLAERTNQMHSLNARLAALEEELAGERAIAKNAQAAATAAAERVVPEPVTVDESVPEAPAEPPIDRASLAAAIADASAAAVQLAAALERASTDLRPADTVGDVEPEAVTVRPKRRRPVRLPVGVFDDSVEAAKALMNVENMFVLVDGYNVTLSGWPDLPLVHQRERLIDALAGLQARTGVTVMIIFDGAEAGRDLPPESRLRGLQVRFTEPDVEADDVIIESVGLVPAERPVTVVSSDNRVRDGASVGGANLLYSQQLLDLLRR